MFTSFIGKGRGDTWHCVSRVILVLEGVVQVWMVREGTDGGLGGSDFTHL